MIQVQTSTMDRYRLMRWLNARKMTPAMMAARAGLAVSVVESLLRGRPASPVGSGVASAVAAALDVPLERLLSGDPPEGGGVIVRTAREIESTRRPIHRDGIHFYNYYTLPAPEGHVAPVILDILCPAGRLPALNRGHLEPAITVNLGPGDIHGRWGPELDEHTYRVLAANHGEDAFILGDSYVEPCYCPHTYSLTSDPPAKILSYTVRSRLADLFERTNRWSDAAYDRFAATLTERHFSAAVLAAQMDRRGYDAGTLAVAAGVAEDGIRAFLDGAAGPQAEIDLVLVAEVLGLDVRLLQAPDHREDPAGKTYLDVAGSRATIRTHKSYLVASMASSTRFPDLLGLFLRVARDAQHLDLDLADLGASHYLVTSGSLVARWEDAAGEPRDRLLGPGDSLWVAPCVRHGFAGDGALIKMGNGEDLDWLDLMELSSTFSLATTLRRGRRDASDWGYDAEGGAP